MPTLPSGLRTYEANEIVRRISQNENIEATDALFHAAEGHKHSGKPGDAPLIGKEGLAANSVTTEKLSAQAVTKDKLADAAVTGSKVARNELDRVHLRSSGISSNVAKFKKVTVTAGSLSGLPTTPYTFQGGELADNHLWSIPNTSPLPQSITIDCQKEYKSLEGMSFGSTSGANPSNAPKGFYVEGSNNMTNWTRLYTHSGGDYELFSFIPFNPIADWRYIRLTIIERKTGAAFTDVSCLAVYNRFHGNTDMEVLDDQRAWGLNARLQGLMIIPEGSVSDNGSGKLTFSGALMVMNPASGTYFRIQAGSFDLGTWGYLYVDLPFRHGVTVSASVGTWADNSLERLYDYKNRIILAQRNGNGSIYLNSALQARLSGTNPDADKVDGIDFRIFNGRLEYNGGAGWKGVGVKSVQRGTTVITGNNQNHGININAVDISKSMVNIHHTGYTQQYLTSFNQEFYSNVSVHARLMSDTQLQFYIRTGIAAVYTEVAWEVIEFA